MDVSTPEQRPIKLFVIKRKNSKALTKRTQRDHEETNLRRRKYGKFYDKISHTLDSLFSCTAKQRLLLNIADFLGAKYNITIDRLEKRSYECLICWYCKNWDIISLDVILFSNDLFKMNRASNINYYDSKQIIYNSDILQKQIQMPPNTSYGTIPPSQPVHSNIITSNSNFNNSFNQLGKDSLLSTPTAKFPPITNLFSLLEKNDYPQNFNKLSSSNISNDHLQYNESIMMKSNDDKTNNYAMKKTHVIRHVISNSISINNINEDIKNNKDTYTDTNKPPYMPIRFRDYISS